MFHTSMSFTVIVPRLQRHCYWWAILQAMAVDSFLLGTLHEKTDLNRFATEVNMMQI